MPQGLPIFKAISPSRTAMYSIQSNFYLYNTMLMTVADPGEGTLAGQRIGFAYQALPNYNGPNYRQPFSFAVNSGDGTVWEFFVKDGNNNRYFVGLEQPAATGVYLCLLDYTILPSTAQIWKLARVPGSTDNNPLFYIFLSDALGNDFYVCTYNTDPYWQAYLYLQPATKPNNQYTIPSTAVAWQINPLDSNLVPLYGAQPQQEL